MALIDRTSTFRGRIVDHGVSATKNGFPQWVAQLVALEIYDAEEEKWVDWSQYDVNEITAYQVLFGGDGKATLVVEQLRKITGWSGASFAELNNMDLKETKIQFRVEENTYQEKTSLQVSWIDEYDAVPGRTVRKLSAEDLKALDTQYAKFLKPSAKPVKAPTKPKAPTKVKAQGIKPTQPKGPVKKKGAKDPLGPPEKAELHEHTQLPKTPPPPSSPDLPTGNCTKAEAWSTVYELKAKKYDDEKIAKIWTKALLEVAPGIEQDDVTDEQWFLVREKVLAETAMF